MAEPAVAGNFEVEPLELIRKTEAGCRRRLDAARAETEIAVEQARRKAEERFLEARASGRQEGEALRARLQADVLCEVNMVQQAARQKAESELAVNRQRIDRAVEAVLDLILERGRGVNEP